MVVPHSAGHKEVSLSAVLACDHWLSLARSTGVCKEEEPEKVGEMEGGNALRNGNLLFL